MGKNSQIPVPAIVSEALFLSAQEQLAENRKLARRRRESAPLRLLQGLTVCGQCRYAYYAKKVSKAAAKGHQRDYAFYEQRVVKAFHKLTVALESSVKVLPGLRAEAP